MTATGKTVVKKRVDFRRALSDQVAIGIEEHGAFPWGQLGAIMRPFNPVSGTQFKGGNFVKLLYEAMAIGSDDPRWVTFKQATAAGFRVRAGAKARQIEFWDFGSDKHAEKVDADGQALPERSETGGAPQAPMRSRRPFYVQLFHASDIIDLPPIKRDVSWVAKDVVQQLVVANTAHYQEAGSRMFVPPRSRQTGDEEYCCDVLRAVASHAVKAAYFSAGTIVDDGLLTRSRLRIELVSQMLYSSVGVKPKTARPDALLGAVAELVKADKHELFRAAKEADVIAEAVLSRLPDFKKLLETRFDANATKQAPKRPNKDIGVLPRFAPERTKSATPAPPVAALVPAAGGEGRNDSRWVVFENTVRREAIKFDIPEQSLIPVLDMLEAQFTPLMNAGDRQGYSVDDICEMFVQRIVEDMRVNQDRENNWNKFCEQVRVAGEGVLPVQFLELKLQELGGRYMEVLATAGREGWDEEKTDAHVREVVFGPKGRRPITPEFVREQFITSKLTLAEICEQRDIPVAAAERELSALQDKGLVAGFVPGDMHAPIVLTAKGMEEFNTNPQATVSDDDDDLLLTPSEGGMSLGEEEDLLVPFGDGMVLDDAVPYDERMEHGSEP